MYNIIKIRKSGEKKMGNLTHAAGRLAVSKVSDVVLKNLDKDREKEIVKLVDFMEKYMDGEKLDINYEKARTMITDKSLHKQASG